MELEPQSKITQRVWLGNELNEPALAGEPIHYLVEHSATHSAAWIELTSPGSGETLQLDPFQHLVHIEYDVLNDPESTDTFVGKLVSEQYEGDTLCPDQDFFGQLWAPMEVTPTVEFSDHVYSDIYPVERSWRYFFVDSLFTMLAVRNTLVSLQSTTYQEWQRLRNVTSQEWRKFLIKINLGDKTPDFGR